MDEDRMDEADAALMRSKLHIRGGKKLLDHHHIVHAIGTLYDAVEHAMKWYYLCHFPSRDNAILYDEDQLFSFLKEQSVFLPPFDFHGYHELMERSLEEEFTDELSTFDPDRFWNLTRRVLENLEVIPFDFDELPEEDEQTRQVLGLSE